MKLIVENIRSLAGRHSISVRPLTLLVGENSSGKSTFLASLSAVSDSTAYPGLASLNNAPYDFGGFDSIATFKGGKAGRAKQFGLGFTVGPTGKKVTAVANYAAYHGETKLCAFSMEAPEGKLAVTWENGQLRGQLSGVPGKPDLLFKRELIDPAGLGSESLAIIIFQSLTLDQRKLMIGPDSIIDGVFSLTSRLTRSVESTASISPIRSTPKRTYDLISEEYDPGGDHIPFVLAKLLEETPHTRSHEELLNTVAEFGLESGLFKKLIAKRLGYHAGSPFQINVKSGGPSFNLKDVGYGVSQSLPIIVQSVLKTTAPRLLLQQPEVHLHPRAQAAMGSFFSRLVQRKSKQFVVETHSDYLIDRIRQDVARGLLSASDVMILFFYKKHIDTKIFELTLDDHGNIQNAPECYRQFFLEEELNLFNRAS